MDTKLICLSFLFGLVSLAGNGQAFPVSDEMDEGYYVVVGVYNASHENLARAYAGDKEAQTGYHSPKKRFYVYTLSTGDYREAISAMRQARKEVHPEAWVFVCRPAARADLAAAPSKATPSTEKASAEETTDEDMAEATASANLTPVAAAETSAAESEPEASIEEIGEALDPQTQVAFLLSNARNNAEVQGEVQLIDTERARLNDVVKSGEVVVLADPENGTGRITALVDVFGYRKQQIELDYNRLFDHENVNKLSDYYVVFFDLVRYHKGDIATMYNVYFFNDAAIMRPESKYEVNSLLAMMKENPGYRIRIHGHTNGKRAGKIISRTDDDPFYALADGNKEKLGSAKALSRERATIIHDYLVSQGVDPDRMEIKAWGGRRMLYDKNSSQAKKNVRVEIEILEE